MCIYRCHHGATPTPPWCHYAATMAPPLAPLQSYHDTWWRNLCLQLLLPSTDYLMVIAHKYHHFTQFFHYLKVIAQTLLMSSVNRNQYTYLINDVNPSLLRTSFLAPQGESGMLRATRLGWASLSNILTQVIVLQGGVTDWHRFVIKTIA